MGEEISLDSLWEGTRPGEQIFDGATGFPEPVRRYLTHAIAPGTRLANAVRLRMHGEIKLLRWRPFEAEQVISRTRGTMWAARTRLFGLPVSGFDRLVDGRGEMRWWMLGFYPLSTAGGTDIARSAGGRLAAESMWLPTMTYDATLTSDTRNPAHLSSAWTIGGQAIEAAMSVGLRGEVLETSMKRWGNPNRSPFGDYPFGGLVEEERTFDGFTIPSRVRVGWYFGSERFARDGEFFRCTIDSATFR